MLASSKSLHDAAIFPHFLNSRTQRFAKGRSGDWNRIYFISRQMGISRAWKNIKGLSSSSNENYYDSQSRSYVIQWTAGGGNDGGKATIAAYTFGSANYYLRRNMWFFRFWGIFVKGSWSHLSLVLQASFNIFFTATEEMSILSHAAQHWPKVINWRFYKKNFCSRCKTMTSHQKVHISEG